MARPRSSNPRSVLIALRVTPRVRYGLVLLARRERCSMSEFVLRTVEARLDDPVAGLRLVAEGEHQPTPVLDRVWSPHDYERVVRAGIWFPDLLDEFERYCWRVIQETASYWKRDSMPKRPTSNDLRWDVLAKDWPGLLERARAP